VKAFDIFGDDLEVQNSLDVPDESQTADKSQHNLCVLDCRYKISNDFLEIGTTVLKLVHYCVLVKSSLESLSLWIVV
jgi:hypothetical protein